MKRKIISVLLCVALLLTLSVNVYANDTQLIPIAEENGVGDIEIENLGDNTVMPLAQTTGIVSGGIYRIKNVASGKYMNVDYGIDADGTNIYQWTGDNSTEQKFKVVYSSSTDSYLLYAMCSSNGTNRVADVYDHGGVLVSGSNIKLNEPDEPPSQQVQFISVSSGKYRIAMKQNNNFVFTSYGTSNGSASGTTATSAGNIFIATYTGSTNQQWQFELLENPNATSPPIGYLDEVSASSIRGWAYRADVPNTALEVHIYITNNSTSAQTVYTTTANLYRSDLYSAGYGNGYHAFNYPINWKTFKPGTYTVRVYAIGADGNNPQLTGSPKTFTVRPMYGVVDSVGDNIVGWVWKPDAPNTAVQAHVYIYRPNGEQVFVLGLNANDYREDVEEAGYGTGYYGFSCPVNWSTLPEERLTVKVYAVDGSGTHPLIYSGYYNNGESSSVPTTDYVWPTESTRVTQIYKPILPYEDGHYGIDIGAVTRHVAGDEIYCFADGYVVRNIPEESTYGYGAYINHINPDQSISTYIQTRYAHMMSQSSVVENTNITKGTIIGYMGNTGDSNEVHLHFETRITPVYNSLFSEDKSYCINPLTYYTLNEDYVLANNTNRGNSNENPWGITFDINNIETETYIAIGKNKMSEYNIP